jgi:hypothetical protein
MTRPEHLKSESEWLEHLARCARDGSIDPMIDHDDLAPARPHVWLLLAWVAVILSMALVLGGCGGGIDTPDEQMGPPETARVDPPRPCPVSVAECHPKPTPG